MGKSKPETGGSKGGGAPLLLQVITFAARSIGILTCIVLWGITIMLLTSKSVSKFGELEWYLIFVSSLVTFLEVIWILDLCFSKISDDKCPCCCKMWHFMVSVDDWVKAIIYAGLSFPLFYEYKSPHSFICAIMLVVCGGLYLIRTFKDCSCCNDKPEVDEAKEAKEAKEAESKAAGKEEPKAQSAPATYGSTSPAEPAPAKDSSRVQVSVSVESKT